MLSRRTSTAFDTPVAALVRVGHAVRILERTRPDDGGAVAVALGPRRGLLEIGPTPPLRSMNHRYGAAIAAASSP